MTQEQNMKVLLQYFIVLVCAFGTISRLHSQGYLVPDGVTYAGYIPGAGSEIHVIQNPANLDYTGFFLFSPGGDTFSVGVFLDGGVRVFLVSQNDPVSLPPILAQNYTELGSSVFPDGIPFYVGLYTGLGYPQDGPYTNPLFGWAQLVNNNGVIELLDGALEYGGGGIYAGTQTIIPIPEPSVIVLAALGGLLFGFRRCRASTQ